MDSTAIVPIIIDGKIYNIPVHLFYAEQYRFNTEFCLSFSRSVIALWKTTWDENKIQTSAPQLKYRIGWENGILNDESNLRSVTNGLYWVFKGFIVNNQPLYITFYDRTIIGKGYTLYPLSCAFWH